MVRWSREDARAQVSAALASAGQGGGFILSDNHGEIPWQVPDEVLLAIAEAVRTCGQYPLERVWLKLMNKQLIVFCSNYRQELESLNLPARYSGFRLRISPAAVACRL
jgi:hypothetical protein